MLRRQYHVFAALVQRLYGNCAGRRVSQARLAGRRTIDVGRAEGVDVATGVDADAIDQRRRAAFAEIGLLFGQTAFGGSSVRSGVRG